MPLIEGATFNILTLRSTALQIAGLMASVDLRCRCHLQIPVSYRSNLAQLASVTLGESGTMPQVTVMRRKHLTPANISIKTY